MMREDSLITRVEVDQLPKGGSEKTPADIKSTEEEDPGLERDGDYASLVEQAFHEYARREYSVDNDDTELERRYCSRVCITWLTDRL
jgi:hypothetical protein